MTKEVDKNCDAQYDPRVGKIMLEQNSKAKARDVFTRNARGRSKCFEGYYEQALVGSGQIVNRGLPDNGEGMKIILHCGELIKKNVQSETTL